MNHFAYFLLKYSVIMSLLTKFSKVNIPNNIVCFLTDAPRRRRCPGVFGREQSADSLPHNVDTSVRADHHRSRPVSAQVHARQDIIPIRTYHRRAYLDVLCTALHY